MSEARRFKVIIESWRGLPHSYSIVNMHHLAILARRSDIDLAHRDLPMRGQAFAHRRGLLGKEIEDAVYSVRQAEPGEPFDALLRMDSPYRITPEPGVRERGGRVFTFGTCEFGRLTGDEMEQSITLSQATSVPTEQGGTTIITPSIWSRDGFLRTGAKAERVKVVPHGADVETFTPADDAKRRTMRERNGVQNRIVFLHVGAMTYNKNIRVLVRAFAEVIRTRPDAHLVLKGTDSVFASAQSLDYELAQLGAATDAEVRRRMTYVGSDLTATQIAELHQAADVYVAPYRGEGFNLPVLEAAACGLTVVTTRGGPTDDFCTGEFTLPVASKLAVDPKTRRMTLEVEQSALVAQMLRAANDAAFRDKARAAGPAHVRAKFTWTHAVERLVDALKGTI